MKTARTEKTDTRLSVYFVRHAQAVAEGRHVDPPLTPLGAQQAKRLARRLSRITFERAYVSSLRRARDTARRILSHHADTRCRVTDDLQEVSRYHFIAPPSGADFRGVLESERDAMERFANGLRHDHLPGQNVIVICHGNIIRSLLAILANRSPRDAILLEIYNASVSILDIFPSGQAVLRQANCVAHLRSDEITEAETFVSR